MKKLFNSSFFKVGLVSEVSMHIDNACVKNVTIEQEMIALLVSQNIFALNQTYLVQGKTSFYCPEVLCDQFSELATHLPGTILDWNA